MTAPRRTSPRSLLPETRSQAEEGTAAATATASESKREEQCRKAKQNLEVGIGCMVFSVAALVGQLCLPPKGRQGYAHLAFSLAAFLSGKALMLLGLNMLGRQELVSDVHRLAAKCLLGACAVTSVLILVSLVAPAPGGPYMYVGLAVVAAVLVTAAGVHWFLRRRTSGGDGAAESSNGDDDDNKHKEELNAAWKVTSSVTNSTFGGLIGVLSNAHKIVPRGAAADTHTAAYVAIFFMFATAIVSVFVATVSKKVPEIAGTRLRRLFVTAIRLANALLLCSLACAAFAAAFVVLRYRVFAALAPLVITAIPYLLLRHCVVVARRSGRGRAGEGDNRREEERVKAIEDIAGKLTMATFSGIMAVFGGSIGEKESRFWSVVMLLLTSGFVCGLGFMLIAAAPASARAVLAPAAKMLEWSSVSLFAATAVAIYGVGVAMVGTL